MAETKTNANKQQRTRSNSKQDNTEPSQEQNNSVTTPEPETTPEKRETTVSMLTSIYDPEHQRSYNTGDNYPCSEHDAKTLIDRGVAKPC